MENWNRRSVLATGAIIAVGTGVATAKPKRTDDLPAVGERDGWSSVDGGPGNARRVGANTLETPDTVAWRYEGDGEPVVVDGTVYLAGDEISALDATDGSLEWEAAIDGRGLAATVADDTVYVGGSRLVALEATTGGEEWSTPVGDDDSVSAPLVAFGTAYVLSGGSLYAVDATDGSLRWERESVDVDGGAGPMAFGSRQTQVVAANDAIWAVLEGGGRGGLVELDPATGETRWSGPVDAGAGSLAATGEKLLIQNSSLESVSAFDLERRELEERIGDAYVTSIDDGVAVTQGRYDLQSIALDGDGRTSGWTHSGSYTYGLPVIVGDTVVVAHSSPNPDDDAVLGLDLEDGGERWTYEFDDGEDWTDGADAGFLVVEDDTVYVRRGGSLVALRPADWEADDPEENGDESETDEDETDGGSDESTDGGGDEDEAYEPGDGDDNGSEETESADDGSDGDDENGDLGNGDDGNGDDGDGAGSATGTDDTDDDGEGMPGFTTGAGIAGGALGLEWLRRRAGVDEDLEN